MERRFADIIERATGSRPKRVAPMGGGCVGDVARIELEDGRIVVAKMGDGGGDKGSGLDLEGFMLRYLREKGSLPVPEVVGMATIGATLAVILGAPPSTKE